MVKDFIARVIITAASSFGKSAFKAFMNVRQQQKQSRGAPPPNPFQEYLNKTLQASNLSTQPMTGEEAVKILHLQDKTNDLTSKLILDQYRILWKKNNPNEGGSFYIQCKIHAAKQYLVQEFPGEEDIYMQQNEIDPVTLMSKQEILDLQKEQQEEQEYQQQQEKEKEQKKKQKEQE